MKVVNSKTPWIVASLLATVAVFGQTATQPQSQGGCPKPPSVCKPAPKCGSLQAPQQPGVCAYNAPGEINIGIQGEIDFFASGSFIYWQPSQDNMAIAAVSSTSLAISDVNGYRGSMVDMNFQYQPGFKVGVGMNLQVDDWDSYAEYTRVHGTQSASTNGLEGNTPCVYATWGVPHFINLTGQVFESAKGSYRNNLDFVDLDMGRMYYVGKSLIFRSSFGARGAWITQNMHVRYVNELSQTISPTLGMTANPSYSEVYARTHCWGVGPRIGLMMDWMLGCGLRYFGSGYADILYSSYKVQYKAASVLRLATQGIQAGQPLTYTTYDKVGGLRTHLDLEMGFGWGSYFDNNNWHVDLSAAYGFQVFFNQNMFPRYDSSELQNNTSAPGNLYVQGLTLTARVDF